MKKTKNQQERALPVRLEACRKRFEHWRQTRHGRTAIPAPLWAAAAALSKTYGVSQTAQALRLNPTALKQHVLSSANHPAASVDFVELLPAESPHLPECIVELENPRGEKMRIHLKAATLPDPATLSQLFWNTQP